MPDKDPDPQQGGVPGARRPGHQNDAPDRKQDPAPHEEPVKCLVWDLDETLWMGTLLEDDEVHLAEELRATVAELDSRGILLSVASKNDHDPAWRTLEKLGIAEYFVLPRIGWGPKSESVRRIAEELNFAPRTIAFIDDNPAERAEVAYHLPEVRCYPAEEAATLPGRPEFRPRHVTLDSGRRRMMYQASFRRDEERSRHHGPDEEFLKTLDLRMSITRSGEEELSRVEELTVRTSQMNATGVHYSDAVLRGLLADPEHEVLVASMTDRFGPHGAIGVMLLERRPGAWHLKLLATSCRVVSFGVGTTILNWLADSAARAGVHLLADFRPTDRNRMMEIAYRFSGFTDDACACRGALPTEEGAPLADDAAEGTVCSEGEPIQRLHLVPERSEAPITMSLQAPDLAAASAGGSQMVTAASGPG